MTATEARGVSTDSGAEHTGRQNAERGFAAPERLVNSLQEVLVDLIELHLQGKQAHWNVVGTNFRDTHHLLDDIVSTARSGADEVAERMRALHAIPDGRSDLVSSSTTLPTLPQGEITTAQVNDLITIAIESAVATMRRVHDQVDADDPTSADILHGMIERLEQFAWFASAENRTPRTSYKS